MKKAIQIMTICGWLGYCFQAGADTSARTVIEGHITAQCEEIADQRVNFRRGTTDRVTYYILPIYPDVSKANVYGGSWPSRHSRCYNLQGSCVTNNEQGNILHNYPNLQFDRNKVLCKYGYGNAGTRDGQGELCLNPCRTIAADTRFHPRGTVIYIPEMRGRICPQSGKPMDGCFVVGDVGSAIKGQGRFDMYAGECARYENGLCQDPHSDSFHLPYGTPYYEVPRRNDLARDLVDEHTRFIENGFRSGQGFWGSDRQYGAR